jgi:hypothetical protein
VLQQWHVKHAGIELLERVSLLPHQELCSLFAVDQIAAEQKEGLARTATRGPTAPQCLLLADTVAKVFLPPRSQNFGAMGAFFM